MTRLTSALVPPLLRAIYARWRSHGSVRNFGVYYSGVFGTFDEVRSRFPESGDYNSTDSERDAIARLEETRTVLSDVRRGVPPLAKEQYKLLSLLVAASSASAPHILDIGGGAGNLLPYLTYSCPTKAPRITVYELASIVRAARRVFANYSSLRYVDTLEEATAPVDFILFGSSIQYFEDYQSLLKRVAAYKPRTIIIGNGAVTDAESFVTAQVNLPRRTIPVKIINRAELQDCMAALGFQLVYRSPAAAEAHFRNFATPHSESVHMNLVFTTPM